VRALAVASAFPDPPFEVVERGRDTGFDIELMRAVCETLGVTYKLVKFEGRDFNRIFDGLASGAYDAVISGTTVTPEREAVAASPILTSSRARAWW
jgi:polar amino acid transport system substrate-binding protein